MIRRQVGKKDKIIKTDNGMRQKLKLKMCAWSALLMLTACGSHYQMTGVERNRVLIDKRYDAHVDEGASQFMVPYKHVVDSMMSPVVGRVARYMAAKRPESPLSNLLADILVWAGKAYGEQPDFALYNMGGIRAALAEGDVTYGDVVEVAPFENKISFCTLTGENVMELFRQVASTGGEALSHGVELVITADGQLKSARLNGKEIDPQAQYRIATIDYVAQGNDKMLAFKKKTDANLPQEVSNNVRFVIMEFLREQMKQGIVVDREVEGRITVIEN